MVGRGDLDQGGPGRRQDGRRADGPRRVRDRRPRVRHRPRLPVQQTRDARRARAPRGLQQDVRDRPSRPSSGSPTAACALRRSTTRERGARRRLLRDRRLGAAALVRVQRARCWRSTATAINRREAEWESRWWSPIINAEHLAMRERAAMIDLSRVRDLRHHRPRRARRRAARRDAPDGRAGRARRLHAAARRASGGFKQDLTIMRLGRRAASAS